MPQEPLGWSVEEPGSGAVHELELLLFVEGENGNVDLRHHLPEKRRGLECVQPLVTQRVDERVHLDHHLAERISPTCAAGANREIPFAEGGKQVRQRLQREDDTLAQRERKAKADADDDGREGPLDLRGVVTRPEEEQGDPRPGQRRCQRHEQDTPIVADTRMSRNGHDVGAPRCAAGPVLEFEGGGLPPARASSSVSQFQEA